MKHVRVSLPSAYSSVRPSIEHLNGAAQPTLSGGGIDRRGDQLEFREEIGGGGMAEFVLWSSPVLVRLLV